MIIERTSLFLINLIVFVFGLTEVILASYIISDDSIYAEALKAGVFMLPMIDLFVGLFFLIIGLLGTCGALQLNRKLLHSFAFIVILLLITEVILSSIIITYTYHYEDRIITSFDYVFSLYGMQYRNKLTSIIDSLQHRELQCCGVRNYTDWANYTFGELFPNSVPDGCCRPFLLRKNCGINVLEKEYFEKMIFLDGCYEAIMKTITDHGTRLGIVTFVLAFMQILSIALAFNVAKKKTRWDF
ncbi:hypothetical protein SK128_016087 [Halocaridina rubra]|uniref:Tetraspanin n=1 Tax=Halocaridina rubra TaxID=373956 RepID=A0AAN9AH55_HALRR